MTKSPKLKLRIVKKPRRPTPNTTTPKPTSTSPNFSFVFENESFRQERGVDNFKPSPIDNLYLDNLVGKWIPGGIPSDYKWHGM